MSYANDVKNQLHMFHDPFAATTGQPKIPDGKVNNSLGYSTQAVGEFSPRQAAPMHMLLFAGQNSALIINNSTLQGPNNTGTGFNPNFCVGFTDSGGVNYSGVADPIVAADEYLIGPVENYAMHRVVSTGLQLKLLNPLEEDDGWFEAVRINEQFGVEDYVITPVEGTTSKADGCIAPIKLLDKLKTREIVNDPSYATGLLRDLRRCQFNLHSRLDYHDFRRRDTAIEVTGEDLKFSTDYGLPLELDAGSQDLRALIDQFIDPSYDMVYIRLHTRNPVTDVSLGSRLHVNVISNQEVYFETGQRENRYHTNSHTIGADAISIHCQARRANPSAVDVIV